MPGEVKRFPDLDPSAAESDTDLLALKQTAGDPDAEPVQWMLARVWLWTVAKIAANASAVRTALGLGSMATQAASAVAITGGTMVGVTHVVVAADGSVGAPALEVNGAGLYHGTNTLSLTPDKTLHMDITTTGIAYNIAGGAINQLFVRGEAFTSAGVETYSNTAATDAVFSASRYRGTIAVPLVVNQNDNISDINSAAYDGSILRTCGKIRVIVTETTPSSTAMGCEMRFFLDPIGSVTLTEIMRLGHAGGLQMFGANTVIDANRLVNARSYTVATLPTAGTAGRKAYANNGRAFNGAGVQEGAGAGTGVDVTDNGTAWKITGTNVTVSA